MSKLRLLDLCCKAGGCSAGYYRAGFDVTGVDIEPQPHYPFRFIQADALTFDLSEYDVLHVSPPCQGYSDLTQARGNKQNHELLIEPFRTRLEASGKPYIIENVERAPMINGINLCGAMFGLRVYRHRKFESNLLLLQPPHLRHHVKAAQPGCIPKDDQFWCPVGHFGQKEEAAKAMGIDWAMTQEEIANAIPPAYTEYIGKQILQFFYVD